MSPGSRAIRPSRTLARGEGKVLSARWPSALAGVLLLVLGSLLVAPAGARPTLPGQADDGSSDNSGDGGTSSGDSSSGSGDGGSGSSRQSVSNPRDVRVTFQQTQNPPARFLNTSSQSTAGPQQLSAAGVRYEIREPLTRDLIVFGHDTGDNTQGFWVRDLLIARLTPTPTTLTLEVQDDNSTVARRTYAGFTGTATAWELPFAAPGATSYTFPQGHRLGFKINSTATAVATYTLGQSAAIWVLTDHIDMVDVGTYDRRGNLEDSFLPNAPTEEREVHIKGRYQDAFGSNDTARVNVTILGPGGESRGGGDATLNRTSQSFSYRYNYSMGLPSGTYMVRATLEDLQGHNESMTANFTMAEFGVSIRDPEPKELDEAGIPHQSLAPGAEDLASYTIEVTNAGAQATAVSLDATTASLPSGWAVRFEPSAATASLPPGSSAKLRFIVTADSTVPIGSTANVYVEATADSDSSAPKASARLLTVTDAVAKKSFSLRFPGESSDTVDVNERKAYQFELKNSGKQDIELTVSYIRSSTQWDVTMGCIVPDRTMLLRPGETRMGCLNVTAPSTSSGDTEVAVTITATPTDTAVKHKSIVSKTSLGTAIKMEVVDGADKELAQGQSQVSFQLRVTNPSSDAKTVIVTWTSPSGWTVTSSSQQIPLLANESKVFTVTAQPPGGTNLEAKSYEIRVTVQIEGQSATAIVKPLTVRVPARPAFTLTMDSRQLTIDGTGGFVTVKVKNTGNVALTVTLSLVEPTGWHSSPATSRVPVAVGSEVTASFNLTPPSNSPNGDVVTVTVHGEGSGTAAPKDLSFTATVQRTGVEAFRYALVGDLMGAAVTFLFAVVAILGIVVYQGRRKR